jgi:uracil permease
MGDGLATFAAGFLGGPSNTTYGENTAVVGMTRNASVGVIALGAIFAIILGFLGKFTALVHTIPNPVLGGVSLLLYGFIAVNGLKVLIQNNTDFGVNKNVIVASAMLVLGLGGAAFSIKTGNGMAVQISGMSLAAIVGILLNLFIKDEEDELAAEGPKVTKNDIADIKKAIKDELTVELKGELLDEIRKEIIKEKKTTKKKV